MVYGIEAGRGFIGLIAPPGMGKTTLLFHLLEKFRSSARTAFLFQTQCNSREFMRFLLAELGYECADYDFVRMHEEFNKRLLQEARAGNRFIVVIDEAQNLDPSVLETVRLLSDFETPRAKLMQIILSGQPELADKLAKPGMIQLRQRVSLITGLKPLSLEETNKYIQHRLRAVGYQGGALFSPEALSRIADFTCGIPRNINNLCFNCLSLGCALQKKVIDRDIVDEVIGDLDITQHTSPAMQISPGYGPGVAQAFDDSIAMAPLHDTLDRVSVQNGRPASVYGNGRKNMEVLSPTEAKAYMQQIATQLQGFSRVVSDVAAGRKSPGQGIDS
jgi:general secretion pathway protein A